MMVPEKLEDVKDWRRWKADVESYAESVDPEVGLSMKKVKGLAGAVTEVSYQMAGATAEYIRGGQQLWALLKAKTGGEPNRTVLSGEEGNGWEAWRRLHLSCEPSLAVRAGQAAAEFSLMCSRQAKDTTELRRMLLEFDERKKKFLEICEKEPDQWHSKSVLAAMLDPETRRHTATAQTDSYEDFRLKVQEFVNITSLGAGGTTKMDIGAIQQEEQDKVNEEDAGWPEAEKEDIGALGNGPVCWDCGERGHRRDQCPKKGQGKGKGMPAATPYGKAGGKGNYNTGTYGKGKGKSKGSSKGGKGGKGPAAGCWNCGGPHYADKCPQGWKGGKGIGWVGEQQWEEGGIRPLYCLGQCVAGKGPQKEDMPEPHTRRRWGYQPKRQPVEEEGMVQDDDEQEMVKKLMETKLDEVIAKAEEDGTDIWQAAEEMVEDAVMANVIMKPKKSEEEWTVQKSRSKRRKERKKAVKEQSIGVLGIVEPEKVAAVVTGEWEEIEMAVDSGASESVTHEDELMSVKMTEGDAKKRGVKYEVADGTLIPNLGEKNFVAVGENGSMRHMRLQVCDVNKSLLSVRRVTQAGNRVVLEADGGYIEDLVTGEVLELKMKEGMYMLKMWVRRGGQAPEQGFTWQD